MRRKQRMAALLLATLLAFACVAGWAVAGAQTVEFAVTADPASLEQAGNVQLTFSIANTSDSREMRNITISGNGVDESLDALAAGASQEVVVQDFAVTQTMLDAALSFALHYELAGREYEQTATLDLGGFSATASPTATPQQKLTPSLEMSCSASSTSVKKGTEVTYTYSVRNTGDFDIQDATLTDPMLTGETIATGIRLNKNSATQTFTYTTNVQMTTVSIPTLTFSEGGEEYRVRGRSRRVVVVYEDLMLAAKADQTMVRQGDTVTVSLQLYNNSAQAISGVSLQDDMGKVVSASTELASGEMQTFTYTVQPQERRLLVFVAKGVDQDGNITGTSSDVITLSVAEENVVPLSLDAKVNAQHLEESGKVTVDLTLTNGLTDAEITNIVVTEQQKGTALRQATLAAAGQEGDSVTVSVDYDVAANTTLQFSATGELAGGGSVMASTGALAITVGAQPTPTPLATTAPAQGSSTGTLSVLFIVLLVLTVLTALALTVLVILQRRARRRRAKLRKASLDSRVDKPQETRFERRGKH